MAAPSSQGLHWDAERITLVTAFPRLPLARLPDPALRHWRLQRERRAGGVPTTEETEASFQLPVSSRRAEQLRRGIVPAPLHGRRLVRLHPSIRARSGHFSALPSCVIEGGGDPGNRPSAQKKKKKLNVGENQAASRHPRGSKTQERIKWMLQGADRSHAVLKPDHRGSQHTFCTPVILSYLLSAAKERRKKKKNHPWIAEILYYFLEIL